MPAGAAARHVMYGYVDDACDRPQEARDAIVVRAPGGLPRVVRVFSLGALDFCLFEGDAVDVMSYRLHRPWEGLLLGFVVEGRVTLSQHGQTAHLGPREFCFYVCTSTFRVRSPGPHRYLVAWIPPYRLGAAGVDGGAIAADMSGQPSTPVLGSLLHAIANLEHPPTSPSAHHLGDAVAAAVHAVLCERREVGPRVHSLSLFNRLAAWLEARLGEEDLSAQRLAEAHFLSARYVRKVFADQGTQVGTYVRRRRLDRIRDDLLDPSSAFLPVSTIAARWGMSNASVLSRTFAREFGESPLRYRRRHMRLLGERGDPTRTRRLAAGASGPAGTAGPSGADLPGRVHVQSRL